MKLLNSEYRKVVIIRNNHHLFAQPKPLNIQWLHKPGNARSHLADLYHTTAASPCCN